MSRKYPSQPLVGVGGIILDGERVLLVRRGREPQRGVWSIPGGGLRLGERLEDGLRREIREEVSLEVRILGLVEVFERITPDPSGKIEYHYVLVDYLCEPVAGTVRAADDAAAAEWVARNELGEYTITEGTPRVIQNAFDVRGRLSAES